MGDVPADVGNQWTCWLATEGRWTSGRAQVVQAR